MPSAVHSHTIAGEAIEIVNRETQSIVRQGLSMKYRPSNLTCGLLSFDKTDDDALTPLSSSGGGYN